MDAHQTRCSFHQNIRSLDLQSSLILLVLTISSHTQKLIQFIIGAHCYLWLFRWGGQTNRFAPFPLYVVAHDFIPNIKCYTVNSQVLVVPTRLFDRFEINVFQTRQSLQIVNDIIDNFLFYHLACSLFCLCSFILNAANLVNISHISKLFVQKMLFVHKK